MLFILLYILKDMFKMWSAKSPQNLLDQWHIQTSQFQCQIRFLLVWLIEDSLLSTVDKGGQKTKTMKKACTEDAAKHAK